MTLTDLPFDRLEKSGKTFEAFCLRLTEREDGIAWATYKNVQGQGQFGVDIEGYSADNKVPLVVSCKHHMEVGPADLAAWLNEFIDHWDSHWQPRGVKKFVLAVTARANDRRNNVITYMTAAFRERDVALEPWWIPTLTNKASIAPLQLILPFFSVSTARSVCGPDIPLDLRAFREISFHARQFATLGGQILAPTAQDYTARSLHLPVLLDAVERKLHNSRLAYVLGPGASGKTVLANIIASKRQYLVDLHRANPDATPNSFALSDYAVGLRLSVDSSISDILHDMRSFSDNKTLIIVDDIHLNPSAASEIFEIWQSLQLQPYLVLLGRLTDKTTRSRFGEHGAPSILKTNWRTAKGLYQYISERQSTAPSAFPTDNAFRRWAKVFGDTRGENIDLIWLSHAIQHKLDNDGNARQSDLRPGDAIEAAWEYQVEHLPEGEQKNLIQLAAMPEDMGLCTHALERPFEPFIQSRSDGVVYQEQITRQSGAEIRYRFAHASLGRLIWQGAQQRALADGTCHSFRATAFARDPLSGIIIALFEAASDERTTRNCVAAHILAVENLDWLEQYAQRGGLDTLRAFIVAWHHKAADLMARFLPRLVAHPASRKLFLRSPLRHRAEYVEAISRAARSVCGERANEIEIELTTLLGTQFADEVIPATVDYILQEPLSGVLRMFECCADHGCETDRMFARQPDVLETVIDQAIRGDARLNEFVALFNRKGRSQAIAALGSAALTAVERDARAIAAKGQTEPLHQLAGFLEALEARIGADAFARFAREVASPTNVTAIYNRAKENIMMARGGCLKQTVDFLELLASGKYTELRNACTEICVRMMTERQTLTDGFARSMRILSASDLYSLCRDVDALSVSTERGEDGQGLPRANVKGLQACVVDAWCRNDISFFDYALAHGPLDAVIAWFGEGELGEVVKLGQARLIQEMDEPESLEVLAGRLPGEKQDIILGFLKSSALHARVQRVCDKVTREEWRPRCNPNDLEAQTKQVRISQTLDLLYKNRS